MSTINLLIGYNDCYQIAVKQLKNQWKMGTVLFFKVEGPDSNDTV